MRTEPFEFLASEGQRLSGLLDRPTGEACTYALFAHCFTCTKDSKAAVQISKALTERGIAVLRFDFTGLGQSEGDFSDSTYSGTIQDIEFAAAAMSEAGFAPNLLIGHSLGGAAVLSAAPKNFECDGGGRHRRALQSGPCHRSVRERPFDHPLNGRS